MKRSPRRPEESFFARGMWQHILVIGLLMGGVCLVLQAWGIAEGRHWQTMVFTVLCFSQFGHALAIRSESESLFTLGVFSNPSLAWTVVGSVGVQLAIIYVPSLQRLFHTQALSAGELAVVFGASTVVFWLVELEKTLIRRGVLRYGRT